MMVHPISSAAVLTCMKRDAQTIQAQTFRHTRTLMQAMVMYLVFTKLVTMVSSSVIQYYIMLTMVQPEIMWN